jgi:hypothetical protein
MCFSAAASFATAALLLPTGLAALRRCRNAGRSDLLPLAALPLGFALQQGLEGLVWRNLDPGEPGPWLTPLALAYVFFAYGLWPAWIPWCALRAAQGQAGWARRAALRLLLCLGGLLGLVLWLAVLADPGQVGPLPVGGSLHYGAVELLQGTPLAGGGPLLYLLVITLPLLLVPSRQIRLFGASLAGSCLIAYLGWQYALSSVWCFFSALLTVQILWILRAVPSPLTPEEMPA